MTAYDTEITQLQTMIDQIRRIRERTCEPKANTNPRYHALSLSISAINKAVANMQSEDARRE